MIFNFHIDVRQSSFPEEGLFLTESVYVGICWRQGHSLRRGGVLARTPLLRRRLSHGGENLLPCWTSDLIAHCQDKDSCDDLSSSACMDLMCPARVHLTKSLRRHWWEESLFCVLHKLPAS